MPIKYNNVMFNDGGTAKYNNTSLSAIKYGATQVWLSKFILFNNGQSSSYTGGWSTGASGNGEHSASIGSTIYTYGRAKSPDSPGNHGAGYIYTKAKIPTSKYKTMTIEYYSDSADGYATHGVSYIGLVSSPGYVLNSGGYPIGNYISNFYISSMKQSRITKTFNISSLTSDYYFQSLSTSLSPGTGIYFGTAQIYSIILS